MKQILITTLILMIISVTAVPASAAPLGISVDSLSASEDSTIVCPLMLANSNNIGAVEVTVSFDPEVIRIDSAANSDFGTFIPNTGTSAEGHVKLGAFDISESGLSGNVKLADLSIRVTGKEGDSTPLKIEISAWDAEGAKITEYTVKDGSLRVVSQQESSSSNSAVLLSDEPAEVATETPAETDADEDTSGTTSSEAESMEASSDDRKIPGFGFFMTAGLLLILYLRRNTRNQ